MKNRLVGMAYIVITFFLVPFLLIMISGGSRSAIVDYKFANKNLVTGLTTYTVIEDQIDGDNGNIKRKIYSNLDKPDYSTDQKATFEKSVNKNDKTLFIGDELYILSSPGFCFDRNELKGKVSLCLKDIQSSYKVNETEIKECYIFDKTYYNLELVDSISEKIYVDIENSLVVKQEVYSKDGKLIEVTEIQ